MGFFRRMGAWLFDRTAEGIVQAVVLALLGGTSVAGLFKALSVDSMLLIASSAVLAGVVIFIAARFMSHVVVRPSGRKADAQDAAHVHVAILDETEEEKNYFRVRIKNLSDKTARIALNLIAIEPPAGGLTLPLPLQITHGASDRFISVPPGETHPVDVFRMFGVDEGVIEIQGTSHRPQVPKQPYVFTVKAFCEAGDATEASFSMKPVITQARFRAVPGALSSASVPSAGTKAPALSPTLSTPLQTQPTTPVLYAPRGTVACSGIGIIRALTIQYQPRGQERGFLCKCHVDFYGLGPDIRTSPTELRLTSAVGSGEHLATLKGPMIDRAGFVTYRGEGDWDALMRLTGKTMSAKIDGQIGWSKDEDTQRQFKLFCEVAIRAPDGGTAHELHGRSSVRMEFEFASPPCQVILVEVWRMADVAKGISDADRADHG